MKNNNFKPFDKVLVRDYNEQPWKCGIFSDYINDEEKYKYRCVGTAYAQCIPYNEQTAHLLGTTNKYEPEESKEWEVRSSNGLFIEKFTSTELKQFIDTAVINNKDITNFNITRIF